jgi:hypothetical protein
LGYAETQILTGAQAAGDRPALARGFAVATSDTGHQSAGGAFDGSFMQDQQAGLDFEFVGIGRLTVVAKQIIETYYGRPAIRITSGQSHTSAFRLPVQ